MISKLSDLFLSDNYMAEGNAGGSIILGPIISFDTTPDETDTKVFPVPLVGYVIT